MTDLIRVPGPEQLKQFLYGELTEEEAQAIEELLFADSEVFNELTSLENDLIDSYVLGKLEGAELVAFEQSLAKSEERRGKVNHARALQRYINERKKAVPVTVPETPSRSIWSALQKTFRVQARALQFAIALVILVLGAGGAWLLFDDYRLRQELARMQTLRSEEEGVLQNTRREVENLQRRVNEQKDQLASKEAQQPGQTSEFAYAATIDLENVAGGAAPTVKRGKHLVTLELPLDIDNDYQTYEITDKQYHKIASRRRVVSRSGKKYLVVVLPVKSLTFQVLGINSGQAPRIIGGDYHLEIRRQR